MKGRFIDVGQADATLLVTDECESILVDADRAANTDEIWDAMHEHDVVDAKEPGGTSQGGKDVDNCLDYYITPHMDDDHVYGGATDEDGIFDWHADDDVDFEVDHVAGPEVNTQFDTEEIDDDLRRKLDPAFEETLTDDDVKTICSEIELNAGFGKSPSYWDMPRSVSCS